MTTTAIGSCLCGHVRFEVPLPALWCADCHCGMCRRAHGAPVVTWVGVAAAGFRVIAGADSFERYRSSPEAQRSFCRRCGSPLTFESTRWAGEVHVARACLPDSLELRPTAHAFWSDRAPWHPFQDGLPRRGGPSGTDPL